RTTPGVAIDVVDTTPLDPSPSSSAVGSGAAARAIRSVLYIRGSAAELSPDRESGLVGAFPATTPASARDDSSASSGRHTIPTMTANTNALVPSHRMSPTSLTGLAPRR